ncbi:hypothetical protein AB0D14_43080 [Streptomyces sp. NPDC048484]|uniref:hypothetical protein n=1 Tax=Streptomyces sp. NPDC048484 TaxID=3155146 RepID=UPI003444D9D9
MFSRGDSYEVRQDKKWMLVLRRDQVEGLVGGQTLVLPIIVKDRDYTVSGNQLTLTAAALTELAGDRAY